MISLVSIAMLSCMLVRDNAELCSGNCRTTGIDLTASLTEKMNGGVADGLLATYEENHNYEKYMEETEEIRSYKGKKVLYFSWEMWLYLMDSKRKCSVLGVAFICSAGYCSGENVGILATKPREKTGCHVHRQGLHQRRAVHGKVEYREIPYERMRAWLHFAAS